MGQGSRRGAFVDKLCSSSKHTLATRRADDAPLQPRRSRPCTWYLLQAVQSEQAKLQELQRHLSEINETRETLTTLPDKVKHDVMVPFGKVAMFSGEG